MKFECRVKSIMTAFIFWNLPDFNANKKLNEFLIKPFFSVQISWMRSWRSMLCRWLSRIMYVYDYRDISMLIELFGFFGLCGFWCKDQNQYFSHRLLIWKGEFFQWDFNDRNQTCSYGETWIRLSGWIVSSSAFWSFRIYMILMQWSKSMTSLSNTPLQKQAFDWDLEEKTQDSVFEEKWLWNWGWV